MWQETEGGLHTSKTAWKEPNPANNGVSSGADPSPVNPSEEPRPHPAQHLFFFF